MNKGNQAKKPETNPELKLSTGKEDVSQRCRLGGRPTNAWLARVALGKTRGLLGCLGNTFHRLQNAARRTLDTSLPVISMSING